LAIPAMACELVNRWPGALIPRDGNMSGTETNGG